MAELLGRQGQRSFSKQVVLDANTRPKKVKAERRPGVGRKESRGPFREKFQ